MADRSTDIVIVGAGFAGMYMLHRARGLGMSARVLEAASGVGGTWYWNRYPGCRCDVDSIQYSYSFDPSLEQEWDWSERYATQPEILRYAEHVADRYDLRRDIQFDTRVSAARFDEGTDRWTIETEKGERIEARWCVMATGCLSAPNTPRIAGLESFAGPVYHTGSWPHEGVDFTGLRVAVIGTGSSGIQAIPLIAEEAESLTVFQRTPNFTVPARNHPLAPEYVAAAKAGYRAMREEAKQTPNGLIYNANPRNALEVDEETRRREYESRWEVGGVMFMGAFADLLKTEQANDTAAEFVRRKIRETVADPVTAAILSPHNIIGCKRLCVDTDYWATFNRDNVRLIDVSQTPIQEITRAGVRVDGREHEADAIVFATGFDAMTGAMTRIDIRGRGGRSLKEKWRGGPGNYLGMTVAGFPNMFMITGPGSPSVLSNMIPAIEQHVDWVADCLAHMAGKGLRVIEPMAEAEDEWVAHVGAVAGGSLRSTCSSWYVGANLPGKPRIFMPYIGDVPVYARKCEEVAEKGYEGFRLD